MINPVLTSCCHQLIKVYAYSQQQYIDSARDASNPVLRKFYEHRAYERTDFMAEIQSIIEMRSFNSAGITLEELCYWHTLTYGMNALNSPLSTKIEYFLIDNKVLEICKCLLTVELPKELVSTLEKQIFAIESSKISLKYLKAIYN